MRETGNLAARHIGKNKWLYLGAIAVFCTGVALGAGGVKGASQADFDGLTAYLGGYLAAQSTPPDFLAILRVCITNHLKYALFSLGVSLTAFTLPLHGLLLGTKGFSIGYTVGFLIHSYGWRGVVYGLLGALPAAALTLPVCAMMAVLCIGHCIEARKNRERYSTGEKRLAILWLGVTVLLLFTLLCVASLYDAFVSPYLLRLLFAGV